MSDELMDDVKMHDEDAMNRMPEVKMKWAHSPNIGALVGALAAAQLDFDKITKDTENLYYKSRYADLAQCIAATQPALAKNGLVVIQLPNTESQLKSLCLTSMLAHSSGEWIRGDLTLPAEMSGRDGKMRFDSQSVGAAMTYARRYAYQAIVGVTAEVDDDGNSPTGIGSREAANGVAQRKLAEHATKASATSPAPPKSQDGDFGRAIEQVGTITVSVSDSDEDDLTRTFTPAWTITDASKKVSVHSALNSVMNRHNTFFLPNGKCYVGPKEELFALTDELHKIGWKVIQENQSKGEPLPLMEGFVRAKIDAVGKLTPSADGKKKFFDVTLAGEVVRCFDSGLHPAFTAEIGQLCTFRTKQDKAGKYGPSFYGITELGRQDMEALKDKGAD